MQLVLVILGVFTVLELAIWAPLWRWRRVFSLICMFGLAILSGALVAAHPSLWTGLIAYANLYRIINLLRLAEGRTQADYLFHVARLSSVLLIGVQIIVLGLAELNHHWQQAPLLWGYLIAVAQIFIAAVIFLSTQRHLRTTKPVLTDDHLADRDLPSLTVAIPARNETEELERCLQSLVRSDYPKLEILVLDDCSQIRRTPEIIRSFAHDGVRFLSGKVPPEQWAAKNFAYDQLAKEASGELLLFCGVDTTFEVHTIRTMVELLLAKKKAMLSLLPKNSLPSGWTLETLMIQPGRYAWELSLPRRWLRRPPVLSTCWLITAAALKAAGGFEAVSHSHSPESYFARYTASHGDGYSFMQSDKSIELNTAKTFEEQRATAIRTRYPQIHRRPELVGGLALLELAVLTGPIFTIIFGISNVHLPLFTLGILAFLLTNISYSRIVNLTYRKFVLRGTWLLPFVALYDVGLLNYSMWQYEFGEVIWKDRNVCIPIMRVIPNLPKI